MKLKPTSAIEYEIIEAGVYGATVDSVTPKDPNPNFDDSKPQLQFVFEVTDGTVPVGTQVYAWTGQTYGERSKLRPWLAILMPDFDPEVDELDTDDLIGKSCRIVVTVKKGTDGRERNRVGEVLPLERQRRAAAAQKVEVPF